MRTCPVCEFHHLDADPVCVRCGAQLQHDEATSGFVDRRVERGAATTLAAQSLDRFYRARGRAARMFARARRPFEFRMRRDVEPRPPLQAAFLSLLPGAGQLYNYQPEKAAFFLVIWIVLLAAAALTLRMPWSNAVVLTLVFWALYAFHDGFRTARRMRGGFWHLRLSLAFFTAWVFQFCILLLLAQFFLGFTVVKLRHMSEPALSPVIDKGDRFAVDILTYHFRGPRVGEIVYYRPRQIVLDQGQNMYIEAPVNGVERIVAGPGETFSRVRGRYFRNDQPVSPAEAPVNQSEVAWDYRLEAPPDSFIVIRSYTSGDTLGAAAPRMTQVLAVMGWEEACRVKREEIIGRVRLVYNPPEHRKRL